MRGVVSGLSLVSGAIAFEVFATPVMTGGGDEFLVTTQRVDLLSTLPAPLVIDEIRIDDGAPGRPPGWEQPRLDRLGASPGLPGNNDGNPFGQGESLREQLLRDFGSPGGAPAGGTATGSEQLRRGGAPDAANPAQAMMWEAVDNALKLMRDSVADENEMVSFSVVGIDFNLTLGGRRSLTVDSELWPMLLQVSLSGEPRPELSARTTVATQGQGEALAGGGARASEIPLGAGLEQVTPVIVEKLREFIADPLTLGVALACLISWLLFETTSALRERRRRRRARRRAAQVHHKGEIRAEQSPGIARAAPRP